jgi:hypothetical protein
VSRRFLQGVMRRLGLRGGDEDAATGDDADREGPETD